MMLKALRYLSLICAALVFGLTVAHVLELPGKQQLTGPEWLQVQHTFYGGFAVVGGFAEILGLLSTSAILFRLRHRRGAFILNLVGALCFLGMLLSYAFGNRPINALVAAWTASTLPSDWQDYRDRWDAAHTLSAAFATLAFTVLLGSTVGDTRPDAERRTASAPDVPRGEAMSGRG